MLKTHPVLRIVNKTHLAMDGLRDDLKELVDFQKDVLYMGHRLGEFRHYPENLNSSARLAAYKEVTDMMDEGYRHFGLNGLELDIRVPDRPPAPGQHQHVYVVHDPLAESLPADCAAYLERNRLYHTIRHFIKKKYYETRFLGIELKLNRAAWDPGKGLFTSLREYEERLAPAGVAVIERVCADLKLTAAVKRKVMGAIGFSCFHLGGLEAAHAAGGDRFKYYLIASTDRYWSGLANRILHKNPPLRGKNVDTIAALDWLSGIWFDPLFYDRPVALFNEINNRRTRKLHYFLSTYYSGFPRLKAKLERERSQPPLPVKALFFDLH